MLTNAGDVPVGANHNVVSILEFRIRVWPAAAKKNSKGEVVILVSCPQ